MALIQLEIPLTQGSKPTPQQWRTAFSSIYDLVNGNLDEVNVDKEAIATLTEANVWTNPQTYNGGVTPLTIKSEVAADASPLTALTLEWDPLNGSNLPNDSGLQVLFKMPDSEDTQDTFAKIEVLGKDFDSGTEDSKIDFFVMDNGSLTKVVTFDSTGISLGAPSGGGGTGDITGVTAGLGLSGGGNSGAVSLAVDLSEGATRTTLADGDYIAFADVSDSNALRKITKSNLESSFNSAPKTLLTTQAAAASVRDLLTLEWNPSSGSMTDGSSGVAIAMTMPDSANNQDVYSRISTVVVDDSSGSEDSKIDFYIRDGGSLSKVVTIDSTGISLGVSGGATGDITAVTAGVGLSGGGVSGAVTLALDISEGTTQDSIADADWLPFANSSVSNALRKISFNNLKNSIGSSMSSLIDGGPIDSGVTIPLLPTTADLALFDKSLDSGSYLLKCFINITATENNIIFIMADITAAGATTMEVRLITDSNRLVSSSAKFTLSSTNSSVVGSIHHYSENVGSGRINGGTWELWKLE